MQATQILLFVVVTVLTGLLVAVGVQVFFILRDVQKTLKKANKILDDAGVVVDTVIKPIVGVASFIDGLKGIKGIVDLLHDKAQVREKPVHHALHTKTEVKHLDLQASEEEFSTPTHIDSPHLHTHISELQERGRRFFHRGGKPLSS